MYATYQVVDYNTRVSLGNTSAGAYATSVLADWVGLLTGTITNVSQLSAYADKPNCSLQGTSGDWTVYDTDAHPGYAGLGRVLRRLCVDGLNYQYLFLTFRLSSTDYLNGAFGVMGGWNTTTKAPTTVMKLSNGGTINSGTVITSANVALTSSTIVGISNEFMFTGATASSANLPYRLMNIPGLLAIWPDAITGLNSFPVTLIAEYNNVNAWSNSAAGCTPIVYATLSSAGNYQIVDAPYIKNNLGNVVKPDYVGLASVAGNDLDSGVTSSTFTSPSRYVYEYARNNAGSKVIPVLPIDVTLRVINNAHFCYAGRMIGLYATLPSLSASDTFTVGADTYVVIPIGAYNASLATYSAQGKLCAKIQ